MELRHLRYFVAVAEELNFTRAARRVRVAQPALSRQIKQLEDELGAQLLERSHRNVSLTPAGSAFYKQASDLLEQAERAVKSMRLSAEAPPLRIGYVWGLFHTVAPEMVRHFRATSPEVAVDLFDLSAAEQACALLERKLDLGFIGFAFEADHAGLARKKIGSCEFVLALPEKHPLARRKVPLQSLAQEFFITISEKGYPGAARQISEICRAAGFRPKVLQAAERGHTILSLVAGGAGVALLPSSLQALPHPGVRFQKLSFSLRYDLFLAWNKRHSSVSRDQFLEVAGTIRPC